MFSNHSATLSLLVLAIAFASAPLEAAAQTDGPVAPPAPPLSPAPAAALAAAASPAVASSSAASGNAFNPSVSLILAGRYVRTGVDPQAASIKGFPLPADAGVGPGSRGFSLGESELGLAASIDAWMRGATTLSFDSGGGVSVEEAYVQSTALDHGLTLKAGRFYSGIGYLNAQHSHAWDFADNPLAYQAMLGTQYGDDGVQLEWLAPTDRFVQFGVEIGRGRSYPGTDTSRNGAGMVALTAHLGDDIGVSQSWRAGVSLLHTRAEAQSLGFTGASGADLPAAFTGSTRVWIADAVWKWAPNGNASARNLKLQSEYLRANRSGSLAASAVDGTTVGDGLSGLAPVGDYVVTQSGWYLQAIYQFMPRWRTGVRIESVSSGAPDFGANAAALDSASVSSGKQSLMLEFNPSEFSRLRLQYARDRSRPGPVDNQLLLQFIVSLGAHGAHGF